MMVNWALIHACLTGITVALAYVSQIERPVGLVDKSQVKAADQTEYKANYLDSPMEYELIDIKTEADKIHLKFAFNVTTEWKSPPQVGGKLSLLLQPPMRLKYEKEAEKFAKSEKTWEALVGKRIPEVRVKKYKEVATKISKDTCPEVTVMKLLFEKLDGKYAAEMGLHVEDSKFLAKIDVAKVAKSISTPASIQKGVASIAPGVYTWTGTFKNNTHKTFSETNKTAYEDWILALVTEDGKKPKGHKNACINRDPLSAKVFFTNFTKGMVLKCNGRVDFDVPDKDLSDFYGKMYTESDIVEHSPTEKYMKFIFGFDSTNYMEKIPGDSPQIKIFMPEIDTKDSSKPLVKEDFECLFKLIYETADEGEDEEAEEEEDEEAEEEEDVDEATKEVILAIMDMVKDAGSMKIGDLNIVDYDATKRMIVLDVVPTLKLEEMMKYIIVFSVGNIQTKIPQRGYWSFQVATKVYKRDPPSVTWLKGDLEDLDATTFGDKVIKDDATHKSCLKIITDTYIELSDIRSQDNYVTVGASETFFHDLNGYAPAVSVAVGAYAPSKYVLTFYIESALYIEGKMGALVIEFPEHEASFDGTYFDAKSHTSVSLPESYAYNKDTRILKIAIEFINEPLVARKDAYAYAIPVPFTPLTSIGGLMDERKWKIDIVDESSESVGISSFKFLSRAGVKSDKENEVSTKGGSVSNIVEYHYTTGAKTTRLYIAVETSVYDDMLFIFKFSAKMLDIKTCKISLLSDFSRVIQPECSLDGETVEAYVNSGKVYRGLIKRLTFVIELDSTFASNKAKGNVKVTCVGSNATGARKPSGSSAPRAYFEALGYPQVKLLDETIELKSITDARSKKGLSCLSKSSKLVSVPFNDKTRGVYYMARLHNCEAPWLPGDAGTYPGAFSFDIAHDKAKALGKATIKEMLRLNVIENPKDMLEENAMTLKRFMEHTLYVIFDKASATLLQSHLIAAKKCTEKDTACKVGGELEAVDMLIDGLPELDLPTFVGDIKYGYYDESKTSLIVKRKVLFEESTSIKNEPQKFTGVKEFKAAIEHVLDDGFTHVDTESVAESFSVLVFAEDKNSALLRKAVTLYSRPLALLSESGKLLQLILVKVYSVAKTFKVEKSGKQCLKTKRSYIPFVKTMKQVDESLNEPPTMLSLTLGSSGNEMYNKFEFTGKATELSDTKVNPIAETSLKGAIGGNKRIPKRDQFDMFFNFEELTTPICVDKGKDYNVKFEELVSDFVSNVRNTVARQNVLFASCVKFATSEDYENKELKYTLAYNGVEFITVKASDKSELPKVDSKCHLYSLYENLPPTLHYDKTFDYKIKPKVAFVRATTKLTEDEVFEPIPLAGPMLMLI